MGISLDQMRQYVWGYFELDVEDLPTSMIDRWAEEGWTRVYRHVKRWPHYEDTATVSTVSGTKAYANPLAHIESMYGPEGLMSWMEHSEAKRYWDAYGTEATDAAPQAWSKRGSDIYLWPTPDSTYTLTVEGHRSPNAFTSGGAGSEPDLPEDFHQLVLGWVMHRCYQHQDDFEGAQLELAEFDQMLSILTAHEVQAPTALPVALGRNRRRGPMLPPRQRFPWE